MIGKHRDGGYAEFIKVPGRNVFVLPDEIPFEHGAIMMCSSATALHALNKARLKSDDSCRYFRFWWTGIFSSSAGQSLRLRRGLRRRYQPGQTRLHRGRSAAFRSMRPREIPSSRFEKQPTEKEWMSRSNWLALPLPWDKQSGAWGFSAAPRSLA